MCVKIEIYLGTMVHIYATIISYFRKKYFYTLLDMWTYEILTRQGLETLQFKNSHKVVVHTYLYKKWIYSLVTRFMHTTYIYDIMYIMALTYKYNLLHIKLWLDNTSSSHDVYCRSLFMNNTYCHDRKHFIFFIIIIIITFMNYDYIFW